MSATDGLFPPALLIMEDGTLATDGHEVKDKVGSEELKKEIQEYVKTHTAPYKYPRIVEFMKELPKTVNGKIRRVALREKDNA